MPTYVTLGRYTNQGVKSIKESPARLEAGKALFKSLGAELKAFYLTMGQYDFVTISEAPNEEVVAKAALALASRGNVTTETLRAFTEDEYKKIIGGLP